MMPFAAHAAGRYTVVAWCGEVDVGRAPPARDQLLTLIDAGRDLVIDLSGVTYLDSAGVAVLVEGRRRAGERGREFALAAVSVPAMKLLRLTRLDTVFPIRDSAHELPRRAGG